MVPVASGVPSPKSTVYWRGRPVGSEAVTKSDVAKGAVPVEVERDACRGTAVVLTSTGRPESVQLWALPNGSVKYTVVESVAGPCVRSPVNSVVFQVPSGDGL